MNNIICCKWGTLYGPEFVNNLYAMCYRNLTQPFRFICLTDDPTNIRKEVETFPIEPHLKGWWPKVQYFKSPLYNIEGPVLALDLDILIVDNIDCFFSFKPEQFVMKKDFWHPSSCVMRFEANSHPHIYDKFDAKKLDVFLHNGEPGFKSGGRVKKYWGDQVWISEQAGVKKVTLWPNDWIIKWKHKWTMHQTDQYPGKILVWAGHMKDQRMVCDKIKHIWHPGLHKISKDLHALTVA